MTKRASWLSLTPEPERELPAAVATLVHGARPPHGHVAAERERIERLVLRGSERRWLAYLREVLTLVQSAARNEDEEVALARDKAAAVLANHHNLLLGLPGGAAGRTAHERVILHELAPSISLYRTPKESR